MTFIIASKNMALFYIELDFLKLVSKMIQICMVLDLQVYSEEQIWEKMETLRKVVGYSVARSATCAEELKALYVFTGVVEPPHSSLNNDTHDIAHLTIRLRFLMSVIGIN